ncbi:hypothetical protein [Stenotrophomonas sp. YIM B06876]|nr:hypothetical protein [Stenotrophomonas sp. YIM B06876]
MLQRVDNRAAQQFIPLKTACDQYGWRLQGLLHCAMLRFYRDE